MGEYVGDKPYDMYVTVYAGRDTAELAYDEIKKMSKDDLLEIHDAALFRRTKKGKIKLQNLHHIGTFKGGAIGLVVGALFGPALFGAAIGGLIGFVHGGDRRKLRDEVNQKLGPNDSALAIVTEGADLEAIQKKMDAFDGTTIYTELTGESLVKLEEMSADPEITAAAEEDADIDFE